MRSTKRPAPSRRPRAADVTTRERLLESAARTIADRGFRGATVREICRRARANVAAVNYHFGSRKVLEVEAARWAASRMPDDPWFESGAGSGDPGTDLRAAVAAFARRLLGPHEAWQTRFMMRALAEPTPALDVIVRERIEPKIRALEGVLARFLPRADARTLRLTALSVVAQGAYHRLASPLALRLLGERSLTEDLAGEIAAHVAEFTERSLTAAREAAR